MLRGGRAQGPGGRAGPAQGEGVRVEEVGVRRGPHLAQGQLLGR